MKSSVHYAVLLIVGLAAGTAAARELKLKRGEPVSGQEAAAQTKATREDVFKDLDENGDGSLSSKEVGNPRAFTQMDLNKDGKVTLPEYNAAMVKKAGSSFQKANADGDNTLTAEEIAGSLQKRLEERKAKK